jgi:phthalate 4,5-dioxygenase oxygenase subunit
MLTARQSERLVRIEDDAPMAHMMRENWWIPISRPQAVIAGGAPLAVRLFARNYVAFRDAAGRAALFDEPCPHRGCSLLLARNDDAGLRCIFHGWLFSAEGRVLEIPSDGDAGAALASTIRVSHYPVIEQGGLLWAWLGNSEPAPFPALPFCDLPAENVWMTRTISPCNWLQGVEATLDSVHVGTLHKSWIAGATASTLQHSLTAHPRYEVEDTGYGMRAAALRTIDGGRDYVRISEFILPFITAVPDQEPGKGSMFIAVPIDDVSHMLFFGLWNRNGPAKPRSGGPIGDIANHDPDNYAPLDGTKPEAWGQDRAAMAEGHFSGFAKTLLHEDIVVQASMGAIVNRTREQLAPSDLAVVRGRKRLIAALDRFESGHSPQPDAPYPRPEPIDCILPTGRSWRDLASTETGAAVLA